MLTSVYNRGSVSGNPFNGAPVIVVRTSDNAILQTYNMDHVVNPAGYLSTQTSMPETLLPMTNELKPVYIRTLPKAATATVPVLAADDLDEQLLDAAAIHKNKGEYAKALAIYLPLADNEDNEKAYSALIAMCKEASDLTQIIEYCKSASEQGSASASRMLGNMYFRGNKADYNIKKDLVKGKYYFERADEQGSLKATFQLGVMNYLGKGVPQDYTAALRFFEKAYIKGLLKAAHNIGIMHYLGYGIEEPDYSAARKYFLEADENGSLKSSFYLGCIYYEGKGVDPDYSKALYYFLKAYEQKIFRAAFHLGIMYNLGHGVPQDIDRAKELLAEARDNGIVEARVALNRILRHEARQNAVPEREETCLVS